MSPEYVTQQHALWREITNIDREYQPDIDEVTPGGPSDSVKFPGWHYVDKNSGAIVDEANHIIAAGVIMKLSGIQTGQRVLEYGAGWGKTSVLMARLGAIVDTVDISDYFCNAIQQQADFYNIPLTPFKGEFGYNPRGDQKYDLIFFYECFHHCLEFQKVVPLLKQHLAPNGKIILAGEPLSDGITPDMPYVWGIRLNAENISIMRYRRWFELGFIEKFVERVFIENGFTFTKIENQSSSYANGYVFTIRQ